MFGAPEGRALHGRSFRTAAGAVFRAFALSRGGNISVMSAVLVLPLTVLVGGTADLARAQQVRSNLQDALDGAVLAGAAAANSPAAAAVAFRPEAAASVAVGSPSFVERTDGAFQGDVAAVTPNAFLSLLGMKTFKVNVRSLANVRRVQSTVCLTAIGASGAGLDRSGSGDVHAPSCRFDVRSTATPAARMGGNGGAVTTAELCVRGTTVYGSAVNLKTGCTIANPLKLRPAAVPVGLCEAARTNLPNITAAATLSPGTYCGPLRVTGGGTVTLSPGVYVFKAATPGGPAGFEYTGYGALKGTDVLLYFAENSTLNLSGSGVLSLYAPTSGKYKGVLFHEADGLLQTNVPLKRANGAVLRGLINLPSRNFTVDGSGSAVMDEVNMVVNRLTTNGNGSWTFKAAPVSTFQVGVPYLAS